MYRHKNSDMKILVSMSITVLCLNAPLFKVAKSAPSMLILPLKKKRKEILVGIFSFALALSVLVFLTCSIVNPFVNSKHV